MNTTIFFTTFPGQLRRWTLHCTLNSSPSFCIAIAFLNLWRSPPAIAAMLCAISTFILLYAIFTSLFEPLADEKSVLSRSLKLGTKIRAWISGLSLLVAFTPFAMITPDFWCGFLSVSLTNSLFHTAGRSVKYFNPDAGNAGFLSVYITTMVEGFVLSFILFMISYFAVMFFQARDRRQFFTFADRRCRVDG